LQLVQDLMAQKEPHIRSEAALASVRFIKQC